MTRVEWLVAEAITNAVAAFNSLYSASETEVEYINKHPQCRERIRQAVYSKVSPSAVGDLVRLLEG